MYEQKEKKMLHFVAFFWVASLLSIEVNNRKVGADNRKVGVDNKTALELDNRIICANFSIKNHPKVQQNILLHSSMITPDIGLNSIFCCLKMK